MAAASGSNKEILWRISAPHTESHLHMAIQLLSFQLLVVGHCQEQLACLQQCGNYLACAVEKAG